ncbi:hypothetical protein TorRG33x02_084790 [Trema orientale]|uniref:Uncharacterized protein n=1 Tax=Trema orientale TaxID=63057 RepID=A0A2P5FCX9_TREOI|nr:hypothetical protein TorRG33x02_084790 [Trema orientale]
MGLFCIIVVRYAPYAPCSPAASPFPTMADDVAAYQKPLPMEIDNGNSNGIVNSGSVEGNNGSAPLKQTYISGGSLPCRVSTPGYQDPRFGFDGSGIPCLDALHFSDW